MDDDMDDWSQLHVSSKKKVKKRAGVTGDAEAPILAPKPPPEPFPEPSPEAQTEPEPKLAVVGERHQKLDSNPRTYIYCISCNEMIRIIHGYDCPTGYLNDSAFDAKYAFVVTICKAHKPDTEFGEWHRELPLSINRPMIENTTAFTIANKDAFGELNLIPATKGVKYATIRAISDKLTAEDKLSTMNISTQMTDEKLDLGYLKGGFV